MLNRSQVRFLGIKGLWSRFSLFSSLALFGERHAELHQPSQTNSDGETEPECPCIAIRTMCWMASLIINVPVRLAFGPPEPPYLMRQPASPQLHVRATVQNWNTTRIKLFYSDTARNRCFYIYLAFLHWRDLAEDVVFAWGALRKEEAGDNCDFINWPQVCFLWGHKNAGSQRLINTTKTQQYKWSWKRWQCCHGWFSSN